MLDSSHKIVWVVAAAAILAFAKANPCQDECSQAFVDKDLQAACGKGCENFNSAKFSRISIFEIFTGNGNNLQLCQFACQDNFKDETKMSACQQGCKNGAKFSKPKTLFDFGSDLFKDLEANDSHRHGGLTINFGGLPKMIQDGGGKDDWPLGRMMNRMNQQMNQMMASMKTGITSSMLQPGKTGTGKMYIMKSGPGYHEEKTYDIGSDGKMTLIENDMMDKANPLDSNTNDHEVEVFEPTQNEVREQIDQEFAKIIEKESREEEKLIQPILQEIDRQIAEQTLRNSYVEGPRLPETGLRSRPRDIRDICHNDDKMWSSWVNCLHLKLGMPRWFLTTSICFGIIFLLWLCFVIPSNAPKQRVKAREQNAKEDEAFAPVVVISEKPKFDPKDLPPAYEDVANNEQLEPVHQGGNKKPAEEIA